MDVSWHLFTRGRDDCNVFREKRRRLQITVANSAMTKLISDIHIYILIFRIRNAHVVLRFDNFAATMYNRK